MTLSVHYNVYGCFRPPREDIELAKTAVEAGFEGIWTGDHFMPWIDSRPHSHHPFPWFGALMNEIPEVPVGTSVTCPTMRYRPPVLAQAIATLDQLSPGRFELGVGVGEALNEAHFLDGPWPDWQTRARMLIDAIRVMRKLWDSEDYITFEGRELSYEEIKLYTRPRSSIDIHWAGWGPTSCRFAGRFADHLLTVADPEQLAASIIPRFEKGLEQDGRTLEEADVTTEVAINLGDPDELVEEIRTRGEYIPDDTELDNPDPRSIQQVAHQRVSELTDDELIEASGIVEDPEDVVERLARFEQAGATRVLVGSTCGDPLATIEQFETDIFPALAERGI